MRRREGEARGRERGREREREKERERERERAREREKATKRQRKINNERSSKQGRSRQMLPLFWRCCSAQNRTAETPQDCTHVAHGRWQPTYVPSSCFCEAGKTTIMQQGGVRLLG